MTASLDTSLERRVYASTRRLLLLLGVGVLVLFGGLAILFEFLSSTFGGLNSYLGWLCVAMGVVIVALSFQRMRNARNPAYILSPVGFYVQLLDELTLPWDAIDKVSDGPTSVPATVRVFLKPAMEAALPISNAQRLLHFYPKAGGGGLAIGVDTLNIDQTTFKAWLTAYVVDHRSYT